MRKTLNQWLLEAKKLRDACIAARTRYLLFLTEFEASGTWQSGEAIATFGKFLVFHKLCKAEEYEEFCAARKFLDDDTIERIGPYATRYAGRIRSSENRKRYVRDAEAYRAREHSPMSEQHAGNHKRQYEPDEGYRSRPEQKQQRRDDRIAELEGVIRAQRERIKLLEREVAELRRQLGKTGKIAAKPRSNKSEQPDARV